MPSLFCFFFCLREVCCIIVILTLSPEELVWFAWTETHNRLLQSLMRIIHCVLSTLYDRWPAKSSVCFLKINIEISKTRTNGQVLVGAFILFIVVFAYSVISLVCECCVQLKGLPVDEVEGEINRMLADLGLGDKRHARVKTLSGGMKRKLSVGIALVGGSKVCHFEYINK